MNKNTIIVSQDEVDELEKINMELNSRKNLILFLITQEIDENNHFLKKFQEEYDSYFIQFEQLKKQLQNKYLDQNNIVYHNWELNYYSRELIYT